MFLLEYNFVNSYQNAILEIVHGDLESLCRNGIEAMKFISYLEANTELKCFT